MLAKPGLITSDVLNDRRNDVSTSSLIHVLHPILHMISPFQHVLQLQRSVAFTSSLRMLSVLLTRHDLQLGLVDAQQQCPLHLACMTGRMDLVEVLLKRDITVLLIHDKNVSLKSQFL
ncbi:hypothetical protein EON65_04565 [archaeon]|nr:MAG: hypothetical protein EON65_04565 [archaeon]